MKIEKEKITLIKRQFLHSLKRGTGEAYLIMKNNPNIDFSNQIKKGVLNIYAYDGQCENDRANYILDLISQSKQQSKIREIVIKGLETEKENTWNLTHLFALAKLFVQNGDKEMKKTIYNRFLNNPIDGSDWVGYSEILELDGFKGLIYIVEKYGKYINKNSNYWEDDWIIMSFQKNNPNLKVTEILEKLSIENKLIRIYLDCIKKTKEEQEKYIIVETEYNNIIDEIVKSQPFIRYKRRNNLNEVEIIEIATQLTKETNKQNIEKLLKIFDYYKFPLQSEFILKLAKQKRNSKNRIVEYAIYALKHLKSEEIREFAMDKINNSKNTNDYLEILISNYKIGDSKLLSEIADNSNNEYKIEQLASIYTDIFEVNKTEECKEPLEILYNKMNCALHRNSVVKILIENNVLSDKLKEEIKYDCNLETRQLLY